MQQAWHVVDTSAYLAGVSCMARGWCVAKPIMATKSGSLPVEPCTHGMVCAAWCMAAAWQQFTSRLLVAPAAAASAGPGSSVLFSAGCCMPPQQQPLQQQQHQRQQVMAPSAGPPVGTLLPTQQSVAGCLPRLQVAGGAHTRSSATGGGLQAPPHNDGEESVACCAQQGPPDSSCYASSRKLGSGVGSRLLRHSNVGTLRTLPSSPAPDA